MFEIFALKVFAILPLDANRPCVMPMSEFIYIKYWILMKTDDRHSERNESPK